MYSALCRSFIFILLYIVDDGHKDIVPLLRSKEARSLFQAQLDASSQLLSECEQSPINARFLDTVDATSQTYRELFKQQILMSRIQYAAATDDINVIVC